MLQRRVAVQANLRLSELLAQDGVKIEDTGVRDRFAHPLVVARFPDGRAAGQVLIEEGLAAIWKPGGLLPTFGTLDFRRR